MTENEVAFEGGSAGETELPEIHGRIETEAVAPEKGGVGLFFSLLYTVCRLLRDDQVARDDDRHRIQSDGMGHGTHT